MLVGVDLGFLSSLVVAALVAVLGPVLGFVVRRKWRRSVARREEIRRLVVLASEESARAELEEYGYGYGYDHGYGYDNGYRNYGYGPVNDDVVVERSVEQQPLGSAESVDFASSAPTASSSSAGGSRQLQYQCAVCSSPTKTRCSRCKAVRYCSGKCQILHWRQGHKDECHPISNSDHRNDAEAISHLKTYKEEPNGRHLKWIDVEDRHPVELRDASRDEPLVRSKNSATSDWKDDTDEPSLAEDKSSNFNSSSVLHSTPHEHIDYTTSESSVDLHALDSSDSDGSDCNRSDVLDTVTIQNDHSKLDGCKPLHAEQPKLVRNVDTVSATGTNNLIKPQIYGHTQSDYSISTCSSVDGSSESSSTEPSTPLSGFWDGAVPSGRSRIDSLEGVRHSPSGRACTSKISDSQSTSCQSPEKNKPLSEVGRQESVSKRNLENQNSVSTEVVRPVNQAESGFTVKNETECRRLSASRSVAPSQLHVHESSDKCRVLRDEARYSSSSGSVNLKNHDGLKVSTLPSSIPDKSYCSTEGLAIGSQMPKDEERESSHTKTSGSHISSSNVRHEAQNVKSAKIDSTQVDSACYAEPGVPLPNARNGLKSSVLKVVDQFRASKLTRHNSLGSEYELLGRYGYKGLFPYESFVKLYNSKIELRPFGLVNCGNSCYANAVLQCLAFTPPLTSYFLQGLHSKACDNKKGWCFTCEFESLVLKAKDGNTPISPIRIISHLESIGSNLGNGREEDAHEFLRYVIDTMQSICKKEATGSGSFEEETTLVGLTFGGYLRSKIECMRCGGKSERQEKMMDLTVEIDGDIASLEEALKQFTHTEILDGENKYQCGRCKSYEKAKKKLKVLDAPNILTIALKRFQSGKFGKLNKTIKFPEYLNLAPYMSGTSDKSPVYQLYGVVVHLDVMNAAFSGHYVCYVRNIQNRWFKVDDSSVNSVELERVLSKGAYMLLYSRCSPRAPRIMRNLTVPRDPRKSKHLCKSRSHSRSPWDSSAGQICTGCTYPSHTSPRPHRAIFEDDSSSEQSSSFFSEVGSCSTESTNRDSTSTDDLYDQIFGELGSYWSSPWRNSSDSDTSSSSSSPLYSRHSPLADLDRHASRHAESSTSSSDGAEASVEGQGFWTRLPDRNGPAGAAENNGRTASPCPNSTKNCSKLVSSHSSSKIDSSRLGRVNPCDNSKSPVTYRDR